MRVCVCLFDYSIEQNLKELQAKVGESCSGERVPSPVECLQWFSQRNLGILKPVATGHQELLDFLQAMVTKTILNIYATYPSYVIMTCWRIVFHIHFLILILSFIYFNSKTCWRQRRLVMRPFCSYCWASLLSVVLLSLLPAQHLPKSIPQSLPCPHHAMTSLWRSRKHGMMFVSHCGTTYLANSKWWLNQARLREKWVLGLRFLRRSCTFSNCYSSTLIQRSSAGTSTFTSRLYSVFSEAARDVAQVVRKASTDWHWAFKLPRQLYAQCLERKFRCLMGLRNHITSWPFSTTSTWTQWHRN